MRQAFHIFRKDARHSWPYIAAVLAVTALTAWLECADRWHGIRFTVGLYPLLALVWWFAAGAAVRSESLVGDRQFWLTRPYSWHSLLAAKLLFLAAFVGLPIFLSDCVILLVSGFNPFTLIPGLLLRQCFLAGVLALPFAVAALTRSLRDFVLAGVVLHTCFIIESVLFLHRLTGMAFWELAWVREGLPWLLSVAALSLAVWQYARRRTATVRALALAVALLAPVLTMPSLLPPRHADVPWDAPRFRNIAPRFDPRQECKCAGGGEPDRRVQVPFRIDGWPGDLTIAKGLDVGLFQNGRAVWDAGRLISTTFGDGRGYIIFDPPQSLRTATVDLSAPIDIDVFERHPGVTLRSGGEWAAVPGLGTVALREAAHGPVLVARTALKPMGAGWSYRLSDRPPYDSGWGFRSASPASPLAFAASPVYSAESRVGDLDPRPHPVVVTVSGLVARLHRELKISQIRLAEYEIKQR